MNAEKNRHAIERDFRLVADDCPVLQHVVHGKRLVYLDNAAMTQMPRPVMEAMQAFYTHYNANVHRGIHYLSEKATDAYEEARDKVARFLGAPEAESIVFTRNATESLNLVAYSWARENLHAGDEVLLSVMEHHSNLVPWQQMADEVGAKLIYIGLTPEGLLDMEELRQRLTPRVKLVAITEMSNVLGTIVPVAGIIRLAHEVGAIAVIDGAQSAAHLPVSVSELDADFYACSGYKMLGPTGIGALYGRMELLQKMRPFNYGGSMIGHVELARTTWAEVPQKFEGGTPNIGGAIGMAAAADYLTRFGMERVRAHDQKLLAYAFPRLREVPGLTSYGPPPERRGGIIAFTLAGVHPHDIATILDREGVAVRAGHHCAEPLHHYLGISASVRASFYIYNREEDVDQLVQALHKVKEVFGG